MHQLENIINIRIRLERMRAHICMLQLPQAALIKLRSLISRLIQRLEI